MDELEEANEKITVLQNKLKAANTESGDRRETIKKMQGQIDGFDGIDLDKYSSALATADKASKNELAHQGKVDEIRSQVEGEYKSVIEKANANATKWQDNFRSVAVDKDLLSAAAKYNAVDPAEIAILTRGSVKMDDDGLISIVDKNGGTMRDDSGDAMDIDGFIKKTMESKPHLAKSNGGGSGSQGGHNGETPPSGSVNLIAAGLKKLQG